MTPALTKEIGPMPKRTKSEMDVIHSTMPKAELKYINQKKLTHPWCPGCSDGIVLKATAMALYELGIPRDKLVVVSGIGCSGRSAAFFNCDSIHGLHGRSLCIAEGVKLANPELTVLVLSGDGDLKGIGGNHLLHTSRRDADITVICFDNETYGLTGGQMSPTTPVGVKTLTSVFGSKYHPVNAHGLITSNHKYFYARSTVGHLIHLKIMIKKAIEWKGFSFVDTKTTCPVNYGRRIGLNTPFKMVQKLKDDFTLGDADKPLGPFDLGFECKDPYSEQDDKK